MFISKADVFSFSAPDFGLGDAPCHVHPGRARLRVDPVDAGWLNCHWAWAGGGKEAVSISLYFQDLTEWWLWMVAVAHRVLPATVWFEEEGTHVALTAHEPQPGEADVVFTLTRVDACTEPKTDHVFVQHRWQQSPGPLLRRIGHAMAAVCANPAPREWGYSSPLWMPPAAMLPWHWPGHVAQWDLTSPWPAQQQRAWLALAAAQSIDLTHGQSSMDIRFTPVAAAVLERLELQQLWLKQRWLMLAASTLGMEEQVQALQLRTDWESALAERVAAVDDWCMERPDCPERMDDVLRWSGFADSVAEGVAKPRQCHLGGGAQADRRVLPELLARFDWQVVAWLRDEHMQPARLLAAEPGAWVPATSSEASADDACGNDGTWEYPHFLLDWGEAGLTRESGALGIWRRMTWRWPVCAADDFVPGQGPLHARWRVWATHPDLKPFDCVCPACGYPHLEDDHPIEIHGCPFCGYDLHEADIDSTHPPDAPTDADDTRCTLAELRQRVEAHGDVFLSTSDDEWALWHRRPDVAALRCRILQALQQWLHAPEPKPPLPLADWKTLNWTARWFNASLHRELTSDDDNASVSPPQWLPYVSYEEADEDDDEAPPLAAATATGAGVAKDGAEGGHPATEGVARHVVLRARWAVGLHSPTPPQASLPAPDSEAPHPAPGLAVCSGRPSTIEAAAAQWQGVLQRLGLVFEGHTGWEYAGCGHTGDEPPRGGPLPSAQAPEPAHVSESTGQRSGAPDAASAELVGRLRRKHGRPLNWDEAMVALDCLAVHAHIEEARWAP